MRKTHFVYKFSQSLCIINIVTLYRWLQKEKVHKVHHHHQTRQNQQTRHHQKQIKSRKKKIKINYCDRSKHLINCVKIICQTLSGKQCTINIVGLLKYYLVNIQIKLSTVTHVTDIYEIMKRN